MTWYNGEADIYEWNLADIEAEKKKKKDGDAPKEEKMQRISEKVIEKRERLQNININMNPELMSRRNVKKKGSVLHNEFQNNLGSNKTGSKIPSMVGITDTNSIMRNSDMSSNEKSNKLNSASQQQTVPAPVNSINNLAQNRHSKQSSNINNNATRNSDNSITVSFPNYEENANVCSKKSIEDQKLKSMQIRSNKELINSQMHQSYVHHHSSITIQDDKMKQIKKSVTVSNYSVPIPGEDNIQGKKNSLVHIKGSQLPEVSEEVSSNKMNLLEKGEGLVSAEVFEEMSHSHKNYHNMTSLGNDN